MQPAFTFRRYEVGDLADAVAVWYRSWHSAYPNLRHPQAMDAWVRRFRKDYEAQDTIWVAERAGRIVGIMALNVPRRYLDLLYVDEGSQGAGIGTALLQKAKALSPDGLTLTTLQQNANARAFYERHGFAIGEPRVNRLTGAPSVRYHWRPET